MIIAIEGIDGAGKNTLVNALVKRLDAEVLSFPRYADSLYAQLAQDALYGRMGDVINSAHAMAMLFALDRKDAAEYVRGFANSQATLLLDRYVASNAAYTAARLDDEQAWEWVAELEFERFGVPRPQLQILLATPPQLAASRAQHRAEQDASRARDHYESSQSLQERTSQHYRRLAKSQWVSPWIIVDPADCVEDIVNQVVAEMAARATTYPGAHDALR